MLLRALAFALGGEAGARVQGGCTLPYSNGQTEGQITKPKAIKRSMYGRAKFDLLRQRALYAACRADSPKAGESQHKWQDGSDQDASRDAGCREAGGPRSDFDETWSLIARRRPRIGMIVTDDPRDSRSAGSVAGYRFLPVA